MAVKKNRTRSTDLWRKSGGLTAALYGAFDEGSWAKYDSFTL